MGIVLKMADFKRQPEPQPTPDPIASITRTPALALIMALYEQLPRKVTGPALCTVMMMAERQPACEASQEAGRIAALLALAGRA